MRRSVIAILALAGLAACGGGGGAGGASSEPAPTEASADSAPTAEQQFALATSFPVGIAILPPELFAASASTASTAGTALTASLDSLQSAAEYVRYMPRYSQADATAVFQSIFQPSAIGVPLVDAPCIARDVAVYRHDDFPALNTGNEADLQFGVHGLWRAAEADGSPCAADQMSRLATAIGQTAMQSLVLSALAVHLNAWDRDPRADQLGLRLQSAMSGMDGGLSVPYAYVQGANHFNFESSAFLGMTTIVHIRAATPGPVTDGTVMYDIYLKHYTDAVNRVLDPTSFNGTLLVTTGVYDRGENSYEVCTDETADVLSRDSGGATVRRYKVSTVQSINYRRSANAMSFKARQGRYCGHGGVVSGEQIYEGIGHALASLTDVGELVPTARLDTRAFPVRRGGAKGWAGGFTRFGAAVNLADGSGNYLLGTPLVTHTGVPAEVEERSWSLAVRTVAQAGDPTRQTWEAAFGASGPITTTNGNIEGMLCNTYYGDSIPRVSGNRITLVDRFQSQRAVLTLPGRTWSNLVSNIRFAPTASCNASINMSFDLDGDGLLSVGSHEGGAFVNEMEDRGTSDSLAAELQRRGFSSGVAF